MSAVARWAARSQIAKQPEKQDQLVLEAADQDAGQADILVLAQGSMKRMEETLARRMGKPVLSSPRRDVLEANEMRERMGRCVD